MASDPFPFLRLPLELREQVYSLYFKPADRLDVLEADYGGGVYRFDLNIYRVNRQIKTEAEDVFRRQNAFIRIETPWPQAAHHIAHEGLVPIVAVGKRADKFKHATSVVQISAPLHEYLPVHTLILLVDDLPKFIQVWFYSALSFRTLNEHLRVDFLLQDPYYPADPKPVPLALQKALLLPFKEIKGLYEVDIQGYDEGVQSALREGMKAPYPTVQHCLETSAGLMEEGDRMIAEGRPAEALETYTKAFHAIHILISGRTRRVMADHWFHEEITQGRYAGQSGMTVRVFLRITLVSKTVRAYLKLAQWEEAGYWGLRSTTILREAMGTEFEDFLSDFVPAGDLGVLYLRTGIAFKKMEESNSEELKLHNTDDIANSKRLFEIAARYLKKTQSRVFEQELSEYGMSMPKDVVDKANADDMDSLAPMDQQEADAEADNAMDALAEATASATLSSSATPTGNYYYIALDMSHTPAAVSWQLAADMPDGDTPASQDGL